MYRYSSGNTVPVPGTISCGTGTVLYSNLQKQVSSWQEGIDQMATNGKEQMIMSRMLPIGWRLAIQSVSIRT